MKIKDTFLHFVRPSEHSIYSPSSMDRIIACPYSVEPSKNIPNISSVYAEEGTLAHAVSEALFHEQFHFTPMSMEVTMQLMEWDKKNPGTKDEIMECAQTYVDVLAYWLNNKEELGDLLFYGLEKGVPIFPSELCFGTADAVIIGTKASAIIDYKHGKGKNVSADSLQLRAYASGVYMHLEDVPEDYKFYSVVVQPRTDVAPKVAVYSLEETKDNCHVIAKAINDSKQKELKPCEGSHCHWCPLNQTKDRKLKCPAKLQHAIDLANEDFNKFFNDMNAPVANFTDPNIKRDEALLKILALYPLIKKVAEDAEQEFLQRLEEGEKIDGVNLTTKFGNRSWVFDSEDNMIEALKIRFPDIELTKTVVKLKTITEIEKIKGKNSTEGLTVRKATKKIAIHDDKVRAVLGDLSFFGNLEIE